MLCVSNFIDAKTLKKNSCDDYKKWKGICSRFKYVVCCPKPKRMNKKVIYGKGMDYNFTHNIRDGPI